MLLIKLKEHEILIQNFGCTLKGVTDKFSGEKFCGLYYDWNDGKSVLKSSYFIGACWLEKNQLALRPLHKSNKNHQSGKITSI